MGTMERRLREMRIRYMKLTINEVEGSPIDQSNSSSGTPTAS
jgi:hypothetical protein